MTPILPRATRLLTLLAMLFTITAPMLLPTEALAAKWIYFNATRAQLGAACSRAGGTQIGEGANYGCIAACGKPGKSCVVDCTDGKGCSGTVPSRTLGAVTTLDHLLGHGVLFEEPAQPITPQGLIDPASSPPLTDQPLP